MPLDFANIVPENNLRLPDALTIKHGPARLLSRFVLQGDRAVRQMGIHLRIRHDFDELAYVNKAAVARGTWIPVPMMFDPDYSDLRPTNSYWLSGESASGEVVLTGAFRVFNWHETTLADEAGVFFCGKGGKPHDCEVTAPAASTISGTVFWGGSLWVRPDYRRHHLSELVGRLGRAFAAATWPVDWMMCLVVPVLADKGVASGYGYKHFSRSIVFPKSHLGDLEMVVAYLSGDEAYADFDEFLTSGLSNPTYFDRSDSSANRFENMVTRISSDAVVQGSISRS
jgi:hypothetical protein